MWGTEVGLCCCSQSLSKYLLIQFTKLSKLCKSDKFIHFYIVVSLFFFIYAYMASNAVFIWSFERYTYKLSFNCMQIHACVSTSYGDRDSWCQSKIYSNLGWLSQNNSSEAWFLSITTSKCVSCYMNNEYLNLFVKL